MSEVNNDVKSEVSGKVMKVAPNGLYLVLDSGEEAFLPKENMHIGKKKKLEEIFSKGFVIHSKIKSQKDGKLILTQKDKISLGKKQEDKKSLEEINKSSSKNKNNKKKAQNKKQEVAKGENKATNEKIKATKEVVKQNDERVVQELKQKTLKDLKKLNYIGNMKISVGRGKKANISELTEEKKEVELPKVPDGLLEKIIKTTGEATEKFLKIKEELKEHGLLENKGESYEK